MFQLTKNHWMGSFLSEFPSQTTYSPRISYKKGDQDIKIRMEVPGFTKKNLVVELENTTIKVYGSFKEDGDTFAISKEISLPKGIEPQLAKASVENGILTITLPLVKANKKIHNLLD